MRRSPALLIASLLLLATSSLAVAEPTIESLSQPIDAAMSIGIFAGNAEVAPTTVTATECMLCMSPEVSHKVRFSTAAVYGLNFDIRYQDIGVVWGMEKVSASSDLASFYYTAMTLKPEFRYAAFATPSTPHGRLHINVGVSLSRIGDGEVDVRFPEFSNPVGVYYGLGLEGEGNGVQLGASWQHLKVRFSAEYRRNRMHLHGRFVGDSVDLTVDTSQAVLGVSYVIQ